MAVLLLEYSGEAEPYTLAPAMTATIGLAVHREESPCSCMADKHSVQKSTRSTKSELGMPELLLSLAEPVSERRDWDAVAPVEVVSAEPSVAACSCLPAFATNLRDD